MGRTKKSLKAKEPVTIRFKQLANGNQSIYLDIYKNGIRKYEFLKLYLIPENKGDEAARVQNANTMQAAISIKAQRIKEMANNQAGIKNTTGGKMLLLDWMGHVIEQKRKNGQIGIRILTVFVISALRIAAIFPSWQAFGWTVPRWMN